MSTPNPINPQGSLLEQKARKKPNLPIVVIIFLAIHAIVLGGILMSGCKKDDPGTPGTTGKGNTGSLPPINTNDWLQQPPTPITPASNPVVIPTPIAQQSNTAVITPPTPIVVTNAALPPRTTASEIPVATPSSHVVATGDSFYSMGKKYNVPMKDIENANPGVDPKKLKLGQKINIPAPAAKAPPAGTSNGAGKAAEPGTYVVKSGDRLEKIARANNTTVARIKEANNLPTDTIKVGQKLIIPQGNGKKSNGTPAPAPAPAPVPEGGVIPPPKSP